MKTFYACGVDWQHELGEAADLEGKAPLYTSVAELKSRRSCWQQCGIVELALEEVSWVEPQDLMGRQTFDGVWIEDDQA